MTTTLTCDVASWRIIVIDDSPDNLQLVKDMFQLRKIYVETFYDIEQGLRALTNGTFNILLLDLRMPLSGWEIHAELQKEGLTEIAVIAFTALVEKRYQTRARELGFYGYILKPVTPQQLYDQTMEAVSNFLVKRGGEPCNETQ